MDPNEAAPQGAAWSGIIVFVSIVKSSLLIAWIYARDVKIDGIFLVYWLLEYMLGTLK